MDKIILTLLILSLSGCGLFKPRTIIETQTVKVPVYSCPKPANIAVPVLPIEYINSSTSDESVVRSYKETIQILQTYSIKLEKALEAYE